MVSYIREVKTVYAGQKRRADKVDCPDIVFDFFKPILSGELRENFYCLYLDNQNRPVAYSHVSTGSVNECLVDPAVVFRGAISCCASGIIGVHNHPSGELVPSEADVSVTDRLLKAGKIINIKFVDNLIVSNSGYLSMFEKGYFHYINNENFLKK